MSSELRVGVIGGGTVGRATARCWMEHADVRLYDSVKERSTHALAQSLDADLIFVCLPTPQITVEYPGTRETVRSLDTSIVEKFFEDHKGYVKNFVLKSTVPIGTTRGLSERFDLPNLVHSPEFLTARCATTDAQCPARNIIGMPGVTRRVIDNELCPLWHNLQCFLALREAYRARFPGVPVYEMSSDDSEAVKLIVNSFFAVKVAFFNEARAMCDAVGVDWFWMMNGVLSDGRIAHSHTKVPGPDGKYGFGGECLPKDLAQLVNEIEGAGLLSAVTKAALERNVKDRERQS